MNEIQKARIVMRDAFAKDSHFRHVYIANTACAIYDSFRGVHSISMETCDVIAETIITTLYETGFDEEDIQSDQFDSARPY